MHATTRRGWNDNAMESRFKPKDQESLHTHVRGIRMTEYGSMSVSRLLINCPALVQIYILSRTSLTHAKYITAMQYTVSASAMVAHFWPRCVNSSFLYWWPWFVSFVVCSRYSLFALPTSQHFHPDPHWLSLSLSLSRVVLTTKCVYGMWWLLVVIALTWALTRKRTTKTGMYFSIEIR